MGPSGKWQANGLRLFLVWVIDGLRFQLKFLFSMYQTLVLILTRIALRFIWCSEYFWFDLVFIKKLIKLNIVFLKKPNRTETDRLNRFRFGFGFLGQKFVQTGLARFFRFGLVLARFFPVWLSFFSVWLGFFSAWVWFGFFSLRLIKPKSNRTSRFFKILIGLIGFFFTVRFFSYFFLVFSV